MEDATAAAPDAPAPRPEGPLGLRGVAFIACGFDFTGGMEGQARRLAEQLAARGLPVTYVTTSPSREGRGLRETRGLLTVYRLPVLAPLDWTTTLGLLEMTALSLLARRRDELDAIYSVHYETGAIAARVGEALGLPVLVKLACSGPFGDARGLLDSPDRERQLEALRGVSRLVAITDEIAREAQELLELSPRQIARLRNGVDLSRFTARAAPPPGPPRVLFLGRLGEQKRVDLLLEALSLLRRRVPEAELDVAGDGPLMQGLQVHAERLGLRRAARFLGRQEDVLPLLAAAHVLALPSAVEGTSNALLEAMASGLPVVATRVGGTLELVRDGVEGLLVPPDDARALAAALERVLLEPGLAARLGAAGRDRVEHEHDLGRVVDAHLELFREVAREPSSVEATSSGLGELVRATTRAGLRAGRDGVRGTARLLRDQVRRRIAGDRGPARGVALLVRDIDALGGMERQAGRLSRGLVRAGVPVTLLTCTAPGLTRLPPGNRWTERRDGARLYRLPLLVYESAAAGLLWRHREEWGAIYAVQLMMGAIGARLGRVLDAPVVVKLACGGPWGDMAALQALPEREREEVRRDLAECELICLSAEIEAEARAAGFTRLHRIPNGVDAAAVAAAIPVRPAGDVPTILFAGRLDRQKGVDLLLHAFVEVSARVPFVRLLLAGEGPEGGELAGLARRLGIAERVDLLGRRDDVWGLLKGATVCALPTRAEGMSNTLLEALAAGCPVVATDIPPNLEVLAGGGGVLVPTDDVGALAHALTVLLERPQERAQLARLGQARVRERFDMERVVDLHLQLLAGLGQETPRPGRLRFGGRFLAARGDDARRVCRRLLGR